MITYKLIDKYTIHVDVPFKMKDNFKQNFPEASWNPDVKKWRIFKTDALLERLSIYQSKAAGAASKAAELEQIEYSYYEQKSLEAQCDKLDLEFDALLSSGARLDAVLAGLEKTKELHEDKYQRNLKELDAAREKAKQVQSIIDKIIDPLEVKQDIDVLVNSWKAFSGSMRYNSSAELRAEYLEAQSSLKESFELLRDKRGVVLGTLKVLSVIPWDDRSGLQPQVVARELYRDVSFCLETAH